MTQHPRGWQRKFEDNIELPDGRTLATLRDAADYVTELPKKEAKLPEWEAAIEALLLVSGGGPTIMARIGFMRALNRYLTQEAWEGLQRQYEPSSGQLAGG